MATSGLKVIAITGFQVKIHCAFLRITVCLCSIIFFVRSSMKKIILICKPSGAALISAASLNEIVIQTFVEKQQNSSGAGYSTVTAADGNSINQKWEEISVWCQ